jgi:hypothetical protein
MSRYLIRRDKDMDGSYPWFYLSVDPEDTARDYGSMTTFEEAVACVVADDRRHSRCPDSGRCIANNDGTEH